MATTAPSSSNVPSRPTYACIRCANRKVKCDRQRPCSTCVKHNVDCVFNPSQPARRRHKRIKNQILTDRLIHCEALLQERGIDLNRLSETPDSEAHRRSSQTAAVLPEELQLQTHSLILPEESQLQTPSSIESGPSQCINKPQVVHGQGSFNFVDK